MIPSLDIRQQITDGGGFPTLPFHVWWKKMVDSIDAALATIQAQVAAVQAATSAASNADTAASGAQAAASTASDVAVITNSGTIGATISGTDAGSSATISVSAHSRVYGNGNTVSLNAGSITGLSYSTLYYVYYDQASKAGGSVIYYATTSMATAVQAGNRHLVGKVTTPAALAAATTGVSVPPPGFAGIV